MWSSKSETQYHTTQHTARMHGALMQCTKQFYSAIFFFLFSNCCCWYLLLGHMAGAGSFYILSRMDGDDEESLVHLLCVYVTVQCTETVYVIWLLQHELTTQTMARFSRLHIVLPRSWFHMSCAVHKIECYWIGANIYLLHAHNLFCAVIIIIFIVAKFVICFSWIP